MCQEPRFHVLCPSSRREQVWVLALEARAFTRVPSSPTLILERGQKAKVSGQSPELGSGNSLSPTCVVEVQNIWRRERALDLEMTVVGPIIDVIVAKVTPTRCNAPLSSICIFYPKALHRLDLLIFYILFAVRSQVKEGLVASKVPTLRYSSSFLAG